MASACGAHMLGKRGCVYHFSISAVFAAAGVAIQLESQFEMFARQTFGFAGSNTPLASMYGNSLDIPECKYQDPGWAALAGVFAARSAALGETGLPDIFDVDLDLIRMRGIDHFEADALVRDFGSRRCLPTSLISHGRPAAGCITRSPRSSRLLPRPTSPPPSRLNASSLVQTGRYLGRALPTPHVGFSAVQHSARCDDGAAVVP